MVISVVMVFFPLVREDGGMVFVEWVFLMLSRGGNAGPGDGTGISLCVPVGLGPVFCSGFSEVQGLFDGFCGFSVSSLFHAFKDEAGCLFSQFDEFLVDV